MNLSRRDFLKLCGSSAVGFILTRWYLPEIVHALESIAQGNTPVVWLQGASDSGCTISLLNSTHPKISDLLLKIISVRYHSTLMAGQGEDAIKVIDQVSKEDVGKFILVMEGSVQTAEQGAFCILGEREGKKVTLLHVLDELAPHAMSIIAVGTCASFGGIPAATPNPTGAMSVQSYLKEPTLQKKIINIPGCPIHPDWFVGTLIHLVNYGMPELDEWKRPLLFFEDTVHEHCSRYFYFSERRYAKSFTDKECLILLGCKGPYTRADCPTRRWNSQVNWCVQSGGLCVGCCSPDFPDGTAPIYAARPQEEWPQIKNLVV